MKKIKKSLIILGAFLLVFIYSLLTQKDSKMLSKIVENKDKDKKLNPLVLNQDCVEAQSEESMLFVGCNGFF